MCSATKSAPAMGRAFVPIGSRRHDIRHRTHRSAGRDQARDRKDLRQVRRSLLAEAPTRAAKFPDAFVDDIAAGGWLGVAMPESFGGAGLGLTEAALMMQTVAQSGAGFSGASAIHLNIFGLMPIVKFGTPEQQQRFLPPAMDGARQSLLRRHRAKFRPRHREPGNQSRAHEFRLSHHRAENLDHQRAAREQDADHRAHHAEGSGEAADRGLVAVLRRFRPQARSKRSRSRKWAARRLSATRCSSKTSRSRTLN